MEPLVETLLDICSFSILIINFLSCFYKKIVNACAQSYLKESKEYAYDNKDSHSKICIFPNSCRVFC